MINDNDEKLAQAVRDTGGPAYPQYSMTAFGCAEVHGGMTLRDKFAIALMASHAIQQSGDTWENDAKCAYLGADAMLAERATTEKPPIPQPQGMPR